MTIDPNCWVELQGTTTPPPRQPQVFTGTGVPNDPNNPPQPVPLQPSVEGDIFVSLNGKGSFVWDKDTVNKDGSRGAWQPLGQPVENTYWGHGYNITEADRQALVAFWPPKNGEAIVLDDGAGGLELKVWDGAGWVDPPNPINPGDDYTDVDSGIVWSLLP